MAETRDNAVLRKLSRLTMMLCASALLTGCAWFDKTIRGQQSTAATEYTQTITVLKPIEGVPITVTYQGNAVYRVLARNALPGVITLMWDKSAYVTTQGESIRLLHLPMGRSLREAPAQQAESPIAPGSQLVANFTGEIWLEYTRSGAAPQPKDSTRKARLFLSFSNKGKRVAWHGEIAFSRSSKQ